MFLRKGSHKSVYVYGLVLLFMSMNLQLNPPRPILQDTQWSVPQRIPLYQPDTNPPFLIADQNRTIHALSSQWIVTEGNVPLLVIFYNQWTFERGWTVPVDVLIAPYQEARLTDAHLDDNGILHVVFWGGDSTGADMFYSKAPAAMAGHASAWSAPLVVGRNAGDPEGGVFTEDNQGVLTIIYHGSAIRNGLYAVSSRDHGENWLDPVPIFFSGSDAPNISQIHAVVGRSGWLHVTWGIYNILSQGRGIYYSRSSDAIEWSEPVLLAAVDDGFGIQKPTLMEYHDTLFSLYTMPPNKITMRRSSDEGETWDDASILFPRHEGVNGEMSLVVDGNDELHLFFGQRIPGDPDIHGMWHSMFINDRWTQPKAVVKGSLIVDEVGDKGFDPNFARAVVSQGNIILVTWRTDPRSKGNGVWYSYKKLDAPELPIVELSDPVGLGENPSAANNLPSEDTPLATASPISDSEANSAIQMPANRLIFQSNPSLPIIIGSLSAVTLILIVAITSGLDRRK